MGVHTSGTEVRDQIIYVGMILYVGAEDTKLLGVRGHARKN